jgi:hypothetical protein
MKTENHRHIATFSDADLKEHLESLGKPGAASEVSAGVQNQLIKRGWKHDSTSVSVAEYHYPEHGKMFVDTKTGEWQHYAEDGKAATGVGDAKDIAGYLDKEKKPLVGKQGATFADYTEEQGEAHESLEGHGYSLTRLGPDHVPSHWGACGNPVRTETSETSPRSAVGGLPLGPTAHGLASGRLASGREGEQGPPGIGLTVLKLGKHSGVARQEPLARPRADSRPRRA